MNSSVEKFFALVRFSLLGENLPEDFSCGKEELEALYKLASKHDIVTIIRYAHDKNGLLTDDEIGGRFKDELMFAAGRVTLQNIFAEEVFEIFRQEKIDFIPLKGAVIRKLYPQDYFRTSTDIDILVRKEDFDRACKLLKEKMGLKEKLRTAHDLALIRSKYETVEVHYALMDGDEEHGIKGLTDKVWENAVETEKCVYKLNNEYFKFFHITHLFKHFTKGGIGIRFFIDSLMIRNFKTNNDLFMKMLEENSITKFYSACEKLVDHWFCGGEADELTLKMAEYVINSGIYGNIDNYAVVAKVKKGGKIRYALNKIFMPYEQLKEYYPKLEGRKWLTPFYQIRRTVSKIFGGRLKAKVSEYKAIDRVNEKAEKKMKELFNELEIKI